MKKEGKIKYFVYARKSTESEDKQMASIDAQISELQRIARERNLEIVEVLSESKSAKAPGRPVFSAMIDRINKGEANGILCWKLNRLARNPVDGGTLSWLVQQGIIQHIQTHGQSFYPQDNVMMMAVELGMANQYVRDLSVDSKRGMKAKAERGWYPAYATLGYMHNPLRKKGEKEIMADPERFDTMRRVFDLMLTGKHTPQRVLEIATDEWGLRNRKGQKVARSTMYRIVSDPFYYGEFEYPGGSGMWYKGSHVPMITRDEYDRIQHLLGKRSQPRVKTHDIPYRGPIRCGECGAMITAEEKIKYQQNGNVHRYTYYHCTKRRDPNCSQQAIEARDLEKQIADKLAEIEIPDDFKEWALARLREMNRQEITDRERVYGAQRREYEACIRKIDNLIDMRANGEITEDEFRQRKTVLLTEKERLQGLLKDTDERVENWLDVAERGFNFAEKAREIFLSTDDIAVKKEIFAALGSDFVLMFKELRIQLEDLLFPVRAAAQEAKKIHARLEPRGNAMGKKEIGRLYARNPTMLPGQDSNLQPAP